MDKNRPRDINELAKFTLDVATGETDDFESDLTVKRRMAGKRGAQSRAKSLSPENRSKIAKHAAEVRWKKFV